MIVVLLVPLLVIGVVAATVLQRRYGRVEAGRLLRILGMGLAVAFSAFAGIFIAGETFDDPGGAAATGLVAAWLVPLAALSLLAWRWPRVAGVVLGVGVAMVVAVGVWYALDAHTWRTFEDGHGPVRAVAVFALALPLSLLAWKRPVLGGGLLLVVSLVPGVLALLAGGGGAGGSTVAVTSPVALIGVLFLCSGLAGPGTEQRR
jgi:hypothetical protein